jgi:hypothetical protein
MQQLSGSCSIGGQGGDGQAAIRQTFLGTGDRFLKKYLL